MQPTASQNEGFDLESPQRPTHSTKPWLPVELISHIIVSLDDRTNGADSKEYRSSVFPALKACSLVCWAWTDLCRPRIFHTISLDLCQKPIEAEITRLSFLHFTAPHLYKYIIKLSIVWRHDVALDTPTWIPEIFHRFVNLRSLYLHSGVASTPTFPAPFEMGIMVLLAKAPLRKLILGCWNFLKDSSDLLLVLSLCASTLEELSLHMCYISTYTTMPKPIDSEVPPTLSLGALRKLELVHGSISISQLHHIEIPNLDSLTYEYDEEPFHNVSPWIPSTMPKLSLKVAHNSDLPRLGPSVRPSCLTIMINQLHQEDSLFLPVMSWMKDCLHRLPSPNDLRQLNINILCTEPSSTDPELWYPTRADYGELYGALRLICTDTNAKLRHVNLDLKLDMPVPVGGHESQTYAEGGAREVEKLREVFGSLVEAHQLVLGVTLWQWSEDQNNFVVYLQQRL